MNRWMLSLVLGAAAALGPAMAVTQAPQADGGVVLVLAAPGSDLTAIVEAAGGRAIGPVHAPMGILAISEDEAGFAGRLAQAGAWAILDGDALAAICGVSA